MDSQGERPDIENHKNGLQICRCKRGPQGDNECAKLTIYKPLVFPDRITVLHKLRPTLKPDSDSFTLDALILSEKHRRVAAKCVEEIVVYDYRLGKKAPMDDWVYKGLNRIVEEQELWKQQCQLKLRELDEAVEDVERQNGYKI